MPPRYDVAMRKLIRSIGVAALAAAPALAAGSMLAVAPTAAAHDVLVSSSPADGATVTEPVGTVELVFNNPIPGEFVQVAVLGADDISYEDGAPEVVGGTVTQSVTDLPDGAYTVSYRVVSSDGHPISGTISFTVAAAGGAPASGSASPPGSGPTETAPAPGAETALPSTRGTAPADASETTSPAAAATSSGGGLGTATVVLVVVAAAVVVAGLAYVATRFLQRPSAEDTEN